jgi:hypothetical protein
MLRFLEFANRNLSRGALPMGAKLKNLRQKLPLYQRVSDS